MKQNLNPRSDDLHGERQRKVDDRRAQDSIEEKALDAAVRQSIKLHGA